MSAAFDVRAFALQQIEDRKTLTKEPWCGGETCRLLDDGAVKHWNCPLFEPCDGCGQGKGWCKCDGYDDAGEDD